MAESDVWVNGKPHHHGNQTSGASLEGTVGWVYILINLLSKRHVLSSNYILGDVVSLGVHKTKYLEIGTDELWVQ